MAVDTNSLAYLIDPFWQGEGINGKPLVAGYMCVYIAGTDQKYMTWQNWDGTRHPFKIPLGSDGRATILAEVQYTYDCYLYDSFGNLVCSRLNVKPVIGGDVTVYGLTEVWHDGTMSGEGTPQSPLSVVSAGKVYTGIEPIVVNNIENKISAQHIPLGVQDPLYFVEDSETACILGFSGTVPVPEGTMNESAFGYEDGQITSYNGSAFSAGNSYEAGDNIDITNGVISGKNWSNEINDASANAYSQSTAWTDSQNYLTGVDLSEYAKESFVISAIDSATSGLLPTSAYATASGSFITALPADLATTSFVADVSADITAMIPTALTGDYLTKESADTLYAPTGNYLTGLPDDLATTGWVESQGYITAVDIPESANWNSTYNTVHDNSATWTGSTANPQIPVTGINGIKISESGDKVVFEVSGDYYPGDNPSGFITGVDLSDYATTAQVSEKLDTTAFSDVSGTFLTAHQDLSDYQTTAGMTAYQPVGNYQTAGDYLTTADSVNFYTTANESGFLTAVPDTYLQNTDLTIADNKVTEISGIPLSAGTELEFEYDAADNISAINSSAISTTPAQPLYAKNPLYFSATGTSSYMGINSAELARILGVDETEILASTATSAFTLIEPVSSFNAIKIKMLWWDKNPNCYYDVQHFSNTRIRVAWMYMDVAGDGNPLEHLGCEWSSNDGLSYKQINSLAVVENLSTSSKFRVTPTAISIIGIGRKEV